MATLLFIEASPRKERSVSLKVANYLLESYAATNPQDIVKRINVWDIDLPEVDEGLLVAKHMIQNGLSYTQQQLEKWEKVLKVTEIFTSADKYLISIPIWNFSIPYKLKHFIDVITQSGLTFNYSEEQGYRGLVTGKPVTLIYTSGSGYANIRKAIGLQMQLVEMWLKFIGLSDVRVIEASQQRGQIQVPMEQVRL